MKEYEHELIFYPIDLQMKLIIPTISNNKKET